jgi:hypothetical protein
MMEVCINCKEHIAYGLVTKDHWSHWHGDAYCHDKAGYCDVPLKVATPTYHNEDSVL